MSEGIHIKRFAPDDSDGRTTWDIVISDDDKIVLVQIPCQSDAESTRIAHELKYLLSRFTLINWNENIFN